MGRDVFNGRRRRILWVRYVEGGKVMGMSLNSSGYNVEYVVGTLKDKKGEHHLCPNCVAFALCNGELHLENDENLKDDITGKNGAVEFISGDEHYTLERETMIRLLCHNLEPDEWIILSKKYGADKFQLHSDFYCKDGTAIQPLEID